MVSGRLLALLLFTTGCGDPFDREGSVDGGTTRTVQVQGTSFTAEFPADPEFPVLALHAGASLGYVRVFGDGRVVVRRISEELEMQIPPKEIVETLRSLGDAGAFQYDAGSVRKRLFAAGKSFPSVSHNTFDGLEMRLSLLRVRGGRTTRDFVHRATVRNLFLLDGDVDWTLPEAPEAGAVIQAAQWLRAFSERDDLRPIAPPPNLAPAGPPSWAKEDGTQELDLVLVASGNGLEIWKSDPLGRERLKLGEIEAWLTDPPALSPSGDELLFRTASGLQRFDLSSGTSRDLFLDDTGSHSPVWSPDGTWVSASAHIGESRYHVVSSSLDGTERTIWPDAGKPLQWSNDGSRLFYETYVKRVRKTYVAQRDATSAGQVAGGSSRSLRVSPDGRYGAYMSSGGLMTVLLDPTTGRVRSGKAPTRVAAGASGFDWSPDSRSLVVTWGRRLDVVSVDGRDKRTLLHIEVGDREPIYPNWSPNGKVIAYLERAIASMPINSGRELFVVGSDGEDPISLGLGTYPFWIGDSTPPAWTPN